MQKNARKAVAICGGTALLGFVAWRIAGSRLFTPCPAWLSMIVEGDIPDRVLRTETTLDRIGLRPGQRVLEVGPGPGRLLIPAAQRVLPGGEAVGLDIQPGMLERLQQRATKAGVTNLSTVAGDATVRHFPPESFEVVYMATVLGEIPDREAALRQCFAVLKPGGRLSITEILPDPHYQAAGTIRRLAEEAGFVPEARFGPPWFSTSNFTRPA
jgi:ubiquinone/menaquinone biosynthesis C-methylase UbiE